MLFRDMWVHSGQVASYELRRFLALYLTVAGIFAHAVLCLRNHIKLAISLQSIRHELDKYRDMLYVSGVSAAGAAGAGA